MPRRLASLAVGLPLLIGLMWAGPAAPASGPRHSGTVVSAGAQSLVLDELVAGGKERTLRVRLTPQTRAVLSERIEPPVDLRHPFADKAISLSDIKPGDFVVVELAGTGKAAVATSVTVTFRPAR